MNVSPAYLNRQEAPADIANANADVWIVMAAYNEADRIAEVLQSLARHGYRNVVVVDDGSRDNTNQIALAEGAWVLRHVFNLGQGAALQTGLRFAIRQGAAIIVTIDADGQHFPGEIEGLTAPIRSGEVEVTLGSRFLGSTIDIPWSRKMVLKAGIIFTCLFSGIRLTDAHNGFRAMSRRAAECLDISQNGMAYASEILDQFRQNHISLREEPVTIRYTDATLAKGQSSWNAVRIVIALFMGRLVR